MGEFSFSQNATPEARPLGGRLQEIVLRSNLSEL